MSIQQLEQENRQLLARADQERERTREVERMVEVMEERMKDMDMEEVELSGEQEKDQKDKFEELDNKVKIFFISPVQAVN